MGNRERRHVRKPMDQLVRVCAGTDGKDLKSTAQERTNFWSSLQTHPHWKCAYTHICTHSHTHTNTIYYVCLHIFVCMYVMYVHICTYHVMYKSKCKWPLLSILVTFLIATTEYMTEDNLGEEGVISLTYWGDVQSIPAEKAWPQVWGWWS